MIFPRLLSCIVLVTPAVAFMTTTPGGCVGGVCRPSSSRDVFVGVQEQRRHVQYRSVSSLHVSTRVGDAEKDDDLIEDTFVKASLQKKTPMMPDFNNLLNRGTSSSPTSFSLDADAFAASAGGAMLGAGLGIAGAISQPELADLDPAVSAVVVGSAALVTAAQDNDTGNLIKKLLGKPTQLLGKYIVDQFRGVLNSATTTITAIPNRIASAIQRQISQTKADIAAMPERFSNLLRRKADESVAELQSIPQKMSKAATEAMEEIKEDIQRSVQEASNEAKLLPNKLSVAAKKKADETAEEARLLFEDYMEEVKTLPRRKKEEIMSYLKGDAANSKKLTPHPPKMPPKMMPPIMD